MTKTATGSLMAVAAGGFVYYLADTRLALTLIVIIGLSAVALFDDELDRIRHRLDAIRDRLDEHR